MTFNLRCGHAKDGPNHWDLRRGLLSDVIRAADPDVLAVQECIPAQAEWLGAELPLMDFHGTPRGGPAAGEEMCGLLWRRRRFEALETGTSWLSPTPDVPGSVGWDAAYPRVMTWARFRDNTHGGDFTVANTHLDHRGARSRQRACAWLRDWLPDGPVVVVGDFNAEPNGAEYEHLTAPRPDGRRLLDAHAAAGVDSAAPGTFHEFTGRRDGPRIDWVMATDDVRVHVATIDHTQRDGRYPSDHFPVTVDLSIPDR